MKKGSKVLKRIRNIILSIIIIAALASVFYFGYYQFQLPSDTYGVIFTKINGWNSKTIMPGTFRFEWEGLIPLNLRIEKYKIAPVNVRISNKGYLPSAEIYRTYLKNTPEFAYSYAFDVVYTLNYESLPYLTSEKFLSSDNVSEWLKDFEAGLLTDAAGFIRKLATDTRYMDRISYDYRLMEDDLVKLLSDKYDYITFVSFTPVEIVFPDMDLYNEGKKQYFEMEQFENDIQQKTLDEATKQLVKESAKLELLEKYGELFTKYPSLIDYYAVSRNNSDTIMPDIELPEVEEDTVSIED